MALVLVSAVEHHQPGAGSLASSVATGQALPAQAPPAESVTVTVEHMIKISKDEKNALERAMTLEWKSVLTAISEDSSLPKRVSSAAPEYWAQPATKLRRLQSEPASPKR